MQTRRGFIGSVTAIAGALLFARPSNAETFNGGEFGEVAPSFTDSLELGPEHGEYADVRNDVTVHYRVKRSSRAVMSRAFDAETNADIHAAEMETGDAYFQIIDYGSVAVFGRRATQVFVGDRISTREEAEAIAREMLRDLAGGEAVRKAFSLEGSGQPALLFDRALSDSERQRVVANIGSGV